MAFQYQMNVKQFGATGLLAMLLASCTTYQQQADLIRGVGEAAAGRSVTLDQDGQAHERDYARYGIPPQEDTPPSGGMGGIGNPSTQTAAEYPVAQRTENPDEVLSPYVPHHRINVAGFKSGQLARDPKNQKIFRIP